MKPFIDENFLSNGYTIIICQSMGGLLASEILLTRPHLFDEYIIVSPSLWWNDNSLVNSADSLLAIKIGVEKKVFVSLGNEHPIMHEVADHLVASIRNA